MSERVGATSELELDGDQLGTLRVFDDAVQRLGNATPDLYHMDARGVIDRGLHGVRTASDTVQLAVACQALGAFKESTFPPDAAIRIVEESPLLDSRTRSILRDLAEESRMRHHNPPGANDTQRWHVVSDYLIGSARGILWSMDDELLRAGRSDAVGSSKDPLRLALLAYIAGASILPNGDRVDPQASWKYRQFAESLVVERD